MEDPAPGRKAQDARASTGAELLALRLKVVQLHQAGVAVGQISTDAGVTRQMVSNVLKLWRAGGEPALVPKPRGQQPGAGAQLTPEQQAQIRARLLRRPSTSGLLQKVIWTRKLVGQLVQKELDITLSARVLANYCDRWGLAVQGSGDKPQDRCTKPVRQWLDDHYAGLVAQAKGEEATIYWLYEPVDLDTSVWTQRRASHWDNEAEEPYRMVSAVNQQGCLYWLVRQGSKKAARTGLLAALASTFRRKEAVYAIRQSLTAYSDTDVFRPKRHLPPIHILPPRSAAPPSPPSPPLPPSVGQPLNQLVDLGADDRRKGGEGGDGGEAGDADP